MSGQVLTAGGRLAGWLTDNDVTGTVLNFQCSPVKFAALNCRRVSVSRLKGYWNRPARMGETACTAARESWVGT